LPQSFDFELELAVDLVVLVELLVSDVDPSAAGGEDRAGFEPVEPGSPLADCDADEEPGLPPASPVPVGDSPFVCDSSFCRVVEHAAPPSPEWPRASLEELHAARPATMTNVHAIATGS
jgi:hypothetical protein